VTQTTTFSADNAYNYDNADDVVSFILSSLLSLQLMTSPACSAKQIHSQLSASISIIAEYDYPKKWTDLLPSLVGKFGNSDYGVVNGVLGTINSIIKRFRFTARSDALYSDIAYTLSLLQAPLLAIFKSTSTDVQNNQQDKVKLTQAFTALRAITRIYYSLNWQDLPEYFEDNMAEWMNLFKVFLSYSNPLLIDTDEEEEPGVIDQLQASIVDILTLYTSKDEEAFMPFLSDFTQLVWTLLMGTSEYPKHDVLASTTIKFLTSLVVKQIHMPLFSADDTLNNIVSNIVVKNVMLREVDTEKFEDDPQDYINADMEGSDTDTRRRCAIELLRGMCRHFEAQTTTIAQKHVASMIQNYSQHKDGNWVQLDAAINLVLAVSVRASSSAMGVSELNDKIDVMTFFSNQIVPELMDQNHSSRPMVKAGAIKFVTTFRNQFSKEHIAQLMPALIHHLSSDSVVVHTYSASCMEKIMTVKENKVLKFDKATMQPFLEKMFTGFFAVIDSEEFGENEYVMKATMRALSVVKEDVVAITELVLNKLTGALGRVCKNPKNPQYNHYLFESIAVLVRSVCSSQPSATTAFESLLFPPFQTILQMEVTEFIPYVFQVLAQLLEFKVDEIGTSYSTIFVPLLTPTLWESKGNVPALTRLLIAYMNKLGPAHPLITPNLMGILGVFQKLLSSKANEIFAFSLIGSILSHPDGYSAVEANIKTIYSILLTRLQSAKSERFKKLLCVFFGLVIGKYGAEKWTSDIDQLQPGLHTNLLQNVLVPTIAAGDCGFSRLEGKVMVLGLTNLVSLQEVTTDQNLFGGVVSGILSIVSQGGSGITADDEVEIEVADVSFDSAFSRLSFAHRAPVDQFSDVPDANAVFVQQIDRLFKSRVGYYPNVIQGYLQNNAGDRFQPLIKTMEAVLGQYNVAIQ